MTVLNELSFAGQADSVADAGSLMKSCAVLLANSRRRRPGSVIASHSSLYQRRLLPGIDLLELLYWLSELDKDTSRLFLRLTRTGPFTDTPPPSTTGCNCVYHRRFRNDHPVALAAHGVAALVSLKRSGAESKKKVKILFCATKHAAYEVANLVDPEDLPFFRWNYVPSPKHARGGAGTLMDLDEQTAQIVLDSGLEHKRIVYGYKLGKYYKFHPDNFRGYHGYPVEIRDVPGYIASRLAEASLKTTVILAETGPISVSN